MNDRVLHWCEVLELVDQNAIPALADLHRGVIVSHQIGRSQDELVEVDEVSLREELAVPRVARLIATVDDEPGDEAVRRECLERSPVPSRENADAPQDTHLIILVGDPEAGTEPSLLRKFAQQLGAE